MAPFEMREELPGWTLVWTHLERCSGGEEALAELRLEVARRARERLRPQTLAQHPTAAAIRRLFRAAGCDPTRYRPSSEALLRRLLKGQELPIIDPLVDLNNCLSVELLVPCCILAEGSFVPPVTLRAGRQGEEVDSLRGLFHLGGKPLLADADGAFSTPITDTQRVKIEPETPRAWLAVYLPAEVVEEREARHGLGEMLEQAPVARPIT